MDIKERHRIHTLMAAAIGNALEWYDFGLYGFFAITLQKLFFPFVSIETGLLSVFSVFAGGFFMRPLGGIFFGTLGDTRGRKAALIASMITMAIPTFFFAFLPTYVQAGVWAVVLFILLRLIQGFAVGGEMMGSLTFLAEHAPKHARGLNASLIYSLGITGGLLGTFAGTLLYLLFSQETILAWAWRLPFLFGIVVGGVGLYIRLKVHETPLFLKIASENRTARSPFKESLKKHPREILVIFLLISFQAVGYYLPFVYLITWLANLAHFSTFTSFLLNTLGLLTLILFIPLCAHLSDRYGRKKIMLSGIVLTILFAYPLFALLASIGSSSEAFTNAYAALALFAIATALYQGPLAATLAELLSTKHRYTSLVIAYNFSAALFGGTAPLFATYLIQVTGLAQAPAFLLIASGLIAFVVLLFFVRETFRMTLK